MNKKQIKKVIKELEFFDRSSFDMLHRVIESKGESKQKKLLRELYVVTRLGQVHIIEQLPKSYDLLENPEQKLSQTEVFHRMNLNKETKEDVVFGPYTFLYMTPEEYQMYKEIYHELTKK